MLEYLRRYEKTHHYTVNYTDRNEGEPMATSPSQGASKYLKVESGTLVEVEKE